MANQLLQLLPADCVLAASLLICRVCNQASKANADDDDIACMVPHGGGLELAFR